MNSEKKQTPVSRLRNNKGFTLIEMAIVLVIIGIILGAVMKGQDLMTNAKAKNVTAAANNWKALIYTYVDRNGKLPGDPTRTGTIASGSVTHDGLFQLYSTMTQTPVNPVVAGGSSYYFYISNAGTSKNVLIVCNEALCGTTFNSDDIELMKSIDSSIDGAADAGSGAFRAVTAITTAPVTADFHADSARKYASTAPATPTVLNTQNTEWASTGTNTPKAAIYYFDKPY